VDVHFYWSQIQRRKMGIRLVPDSEGIYALGETRGLEAHAAGASRISGPTAAGAFGVHAQQQQAHSACIAGATAAGAFGEGEKFQVFAQSPGLMANDIELDKKITVSCKKSCP
jgi:hypothetical protein